jgi:hypothetical protein
MSEIGELQSGIGLGEGVCSREGYIESSAQKTQKRDNHMPGCWVPNLVTTHEKGEEMWQRAKAWHNIGVLKAVSVPLFIINDVYREPRALI